MTRFAHAVRDERGGIDGTTTGDQDQKEVCIATYYAKNKAGKAWAYVLRARDPELAERIAKNMELIADNDNIGYSQKKRMGWYNSALANGGDITKAKGDGDCSSTVSGGSRLAGANVPANLATSTMLKAFRESGQFEILTDAIYIKSSDYLRRGDILLRQGHTAVMVDSGPNAGQSEETTLPTGKAHRIIVDGVKQWCNVRSGPSTENSKIGRAYLNEIFNAYAFIEEWYQIDFHGEEGFIFMDYVSEVDE